MFLTPLRRLRRILKDAAKPISGGKEMTMNKPIQFLGTSLILSLALLGCKSKMESTGDAYLKAGDPGNAMAQYENAMQQGAVSADFYSNYTDAHIALLQVGLESDPAAETLDPLKDSLLSLLKQHPDAAKEAAASAVLLEIGSKRLDMGTEEGGFQFLNAAAALPGKSADIDAKVDAAKKAYQTGKLKEISDKLDESATDGTAGIAADYAMNQLALVLGSETPEMAALWSKIREKNLPTYLFYAAPGLLDKAADARINKYGMMIAIVKYVAPPAPVLIGIKVWNNTSGPIDIDGSNFKLVDRQGNAYEAGTRLQALKKKATVELGKESEQGGLIFKLPKDAQPDYLELTVDDGRTSRKYLP